MNTYISFFIFTCHLVLDACLAINGFVSFLGYVDCQVLVLVLNLISKSIFQGAARGGAFLFLIKMEWFSIKLCFLIPLDQYCWFLIMFDYVLLEFKHR